MKKKKYKFRVKMRIEELSRISLSSGVFFCKARLSGGGGDWSALTTRENLASNRVYWNSDPFDFPCKLTSSPATGVLETCTCRISVRKEVKGGKSHDKVGYVDVNLAEYAGAGLVTRHYILEGYDGKKNRQDNCILKISATMMLTSGDPLFKPQVTHNDFPLSGLGDAVKLSSSDSYITVGTRNLSDDGDHFKRPCSDSLSIPTESPSHRHKRNISNGSGGVFNRVNSTETRGSGSIPNHPFSHSRQSSNTTADSACADLDTCNFQSPLQRNKLPPLPPVSVEKRSSHRRMNETRPNASEVIESIFNGEDLTLDESNTDEGIELNMFLEDGVSTMSKIETRRHRDRGTNPFPTDLADRFKTL